MMTDELRALLDEHEQPGMSMPPCPDTGSTMGSVGYREAWRTAWCQAGILHDDTVLKLAKARRDELAACNAAADAVAMTNVVKAERDEARQQRDEMRDLWHNATGEWRNFPDEGGA